MSLCQRGSTVVEFVFFVGLWVVIVSAFVLCCRIKRVQMEALSIAQWSTKLHSTGLVAPSSMDAWITHYFSHIPSGDISWSWTRGRFMRTPASRFYRLMETEVKARFSDLPLVIKEHVVIQEASEL